MDLTRNIQEFLHGNEDGGSPERGPRDRYASFDYCFNCFQSFRESGRPEALAAPEHLQASCLQLGFYLASWGMLRGSSSLLKQSVVIYKPVVRAIADMNRAVWEIDAHCYTDANLAILLKCSEDIRAAFVWMRVVAPRWRSRAGPPSRTLCRCPSASSMPPRTGVCTRGENSTRRAAATRSSEISGRSLSICRG